MSHRRDYELIPIANPAARRSDEKLVKITIEIPEDNTEEIEEIAKTMRGNAGLFLTDDLIY